MSRVIEQIKTLIRGSRFTEEEIRDLLATLAAAYEPSDIPSEKGTGNYLVEKEVIRVKVD